MHTRLLAVRLVSWSTALCVDIQVPHLNALICTAVGYACRDRSWEIKVKTGVEEINVLKLGMS